MISKEEPLRKVQEACHQGFAARVADLNALKEALGDQVVEIVSSARGKRVVRQWEMVARGHGRNDVQGIKETLWAGAEELGFAYSVEDRPDGAQFHVSKCPFADMARALDAADWGYVCFCADDEHIVEGFNPRMGLRRTKTLMEGHDCCDHFYFMKEG